MNSIQLELFPQEVIRIWSDTQTEIVYFEYEGQQAWASIGEVSPLMLIIKEESGGRFEDMFPGITIQDSFSQKFLCPVGTWERLNSM